MANCAVFMCKNNQRITKNVKFYRFPKDPTLCEEWVKFCNSNRPINTNNARICSKHFSDKFDYKSMKQKLQNYSPINRRRIMAISIPTITDPMHSTSPHLPLTPDKTGATEKCIRSRKIRKNLFRVTKSESLEPIEHGVKVLTHDESDCPYKKELHEKCQEWGKINFEKDREWRARIEKLQQKIKEGNMKKIHLERQLKAQDENSKIVAAVRSLFTPGQVKRLVSKKNVHWSAEDISAAISLRSVGPKAYRYLKYQCQYPLPSLSTLRRWAATFRVEPGLCFEF